MTRDEVLAYFGWPQHEDDARRAVVAALSIVETVAGLDSPAGETLACRIGIATGLVVVGDLIGEGVAREHAVVGRPRTSPPGGKRSQARAKS